MIIEKEHYNIRPSDYPYKKQSSSKPYVPDTYLCKYCDYEMNKWDYMIDHLREKHGSMLKCMVLDCECSETIYKSRKVIPDRGHRRNVYRKRPLVVIMK